MNSEEEEIKKEMKNSKGFRNRDGDVTITKKEKR